MSVIMSGIKSNVLYLGADNRTSTVDDIPIRDDMTKIVVINDKVAVAFAGYAGTQDYFDSMIRGLRNREKYTVESVLRFFRLMYLICKVSHKRENAKNILYLGSRFIIAGKNRKNECCIYIMSFINGKIEKSKQLKGFIFPPSDISEKECCDLYAMNMVYCNDFIQKTVKDIAKKSRVVSTSGDMWVYDMNTNSSSLIHFE